MTENLRTTIHNGHNNICIIRAQFIIHSLYFSQYPILTVYPMTYLMAVGHQCSGTSSYCDGCGMSLDEIHNNLISEQHNMMSTSKPCTWCNLPSGLTVLKHRTGAQSCYESNTAHGHAILLQSSYHGKHVPESPVKVSCIKKSRVCK
jgi:hypothetical protein